MTYEEEQAKWINRFVGYKPGYRLNFQPRGHRELVLHITTDLPNAINDAGPSPAYVAVITLDGSGAGVVHAMDQIRQALRRFELHEVDEWLKLGPVRWFDPHAPGVDPDPQDTEA